MKKPLLFALTLVLSGNLLLASGCSTPIKRLHKAYNKSDIETICKVVDTAKEPWLVADGAEYLVRLKASNAMTSTMRETRVLPVLQKRLSDEYLSQEALANVAVALLKLGNAEDIPLVISTLERLTDTDEHCKLLEALTSRCTPEAIAAMQHDAQSSDVLVNRTAVKALNTCKGKEQPAAAAPKEGQNTDKAPSSSSNAAKRRR